MGDLNKTVVILLAGGKGERLLPLTEHRAKPAVPFGGKWRVVDFVLSNCLHSGLHKIIVPTQYKSASLGDHLGLGWGYIFVNERGERLTSIQPQQRTTKNLKPYEGTADAVFENIHSLRKVKPELILILAGDHIYRMDYGDLIKFHREKEAVLTISALEVKREAASGSFGVLSVDENNRAVEFQEKPKDPKPLPYDSEKCLASMGVYVFDPKTMVKELAEDANDPKSKHDFGKDIIPKMIEKKDKVFVFPFRGYWKDVGTIDEYYLANMDLASVVPQLNLYDNDWRWLTSERKLPPAKIVFKAEIRESIISEGCVIDDAQVYNSIISPEVKIGTNSYVSGSIIFDNVIVGNNVQIEKAIIDKENIIPDGSVIKAGNMKYDGKTEITPSGIVIIPRHYDFSSWP